jgi:hypothetical protein
MPSAAPVTPAGVRDGDPAALIGLCAVRGPSVVAYCRHVAGDAEAADAAAEAFAHFRRAVVDTPQLTDLDPEALLISATRTAAARHGARAGDGVAGVCAEVPGLLAARADKSISVGDLARLDEHLERCWACRAPVARFKAAERAYRDPSEPAIDDEIAAQIFVALATAAPSPAVAAPAAPPEATAGDNGQPMPAPADTDAPAALVALDQPTTEFQTPDVLDPDPVAAEVAIADVPESPRRPGVVGALLGSFGRGQGRSSLTLPPRVDEPEPESELVLEGKPARGRGRERAAAGAAIGAPLPRARREPQPQPASGGDRGDRPARRLPLVLPIVLVIIAIVIALFVSGVFGGSDPASSPRVAVPSDTPADGRPADVVVVPGAADATGDAVETAKARDRRRARELAERRRQAAADRETVKTTPAPAAGATAPPPAVTPPPPSNPSAAANKGAATTKKSGSGRKIDAGSGATGAEQIPPPADSSTVPDLAPPPEPATTP